MRGWGGPPLRDHLWRGPPLPVTKIIPVNEGGGDLNRCIEPKQYHDIRGHYNRFDIFSLEVNRTPLEPIRFRSSSVHAETQIAADAGANDLEDDTASIVRLRASIS
jgi:hypothetical protein